MTLRSSAELSRVECQPVAIPMNAFSIAARQDGAPPFESAFREALPAMWAIPDDDVLVVNLDVPKLYTKVRGVLPKLLELQADLERLPDFDVELIRQLDVFSRALAHTHAVCLASYQPASELPALLATAGEWRRLLRADAQALLGRGLLPRGCLDKLRGRRGYKNVAFDLAALSALLQRHWPVIRGKTAVTLAEVAQASTLAEQLLTAVGLREHGPANQSQNTELRKRAFTLVVTTYDQLRRGVSYLRWNDGDADAWLPSLYGRRAKKTSARVRLRATEDRGGRGA